MYERAVDKVWIGNIRVAISEEYQPGFICFAAVRLDEITYNVVEYKHT